MKSAFLKLDLNDLIKSAIMAGLTAIGAIIIPVLESGKLPDWPMLGHAAVTGLGIAFAYLLKNFLTSSDDKFLKKESQA
jgi:hypothetical protein